ncbi:MAG TPA: ROK family protein [Terriglobales bacterium]|nr:ROK family protein [Terriglobales bacterium]
MSRLRTLLFSARCPSRTLKSYVRQHLLRRRRRRHKVAAGLVNSQGEILYKTRVPMVGTGTAEQGLVCIKNAIDAVLAEHPASAIAGIGVASPGPLDPRTGMILYTPNIPCWRDFSLREAIYGAYGMPTRVDNDANAAGLAEAVWGAGRGYSSVFYATLGTGIGTAIVLDRNLYYGRTGLAAEGGHQTIDYNAPCLCECGKRGCIESMASGTAIGRRARAAVSEDPRRGAAILAAAGGRAENINARVVSEAWRAGDPLATELLEGTARLLSIWLGNVVDLLEPDVIVVGGGMSEVFSEFFPQMLAELPSWSLNRRCSETPLVAAQYGEDSGIAGAAALCLVQPLAAKA